MVYENEFTVPKEWKGEEIRINFGAVDYRCCVYINNQCVGTHIGGQTPFSFQITRYLNWNRETIRVEVEDPLTDETIPRGKQILGRYIKIYLVYTKYRNLAECVD